MNFYSITRKGQTPILALQNNWTIYHAAGLTQALHELKNLSFQSIIVEPRDLQELDTVGACILQDWLQKCEQVKIQVELREFQPGQQLLFNRVKEAAELEVPPPEPKPGMIVAMVNHCGRATVEMTQQVTDLVIFLGTTAIAFLMTCLQPRKWRLPDLARHIEETGINAIPIVSLMAFLIAIVLAYQGAYQLRQYGGEIYTIDLTAIAVLREMGVLLTSIMVAGRSGSAFAAEIGVMKVNEEIDALRTLGLSPFSVLVLPRVLALIITLPLLTFWADMMGLLGTAFLLMPLIDISWSQFTNHVSEAVVFSTYGVGLLKAPFFALIIALVGCLRGMQVTSSAESVGQMTTKAVVESILLVMLADAVLSILFTRLHI